MNNKGFMMAEVIVVASIILVSLTSFYALYTKTISVYNSRLTYNDVSTLYELANFRNKNEFIISGSYMSNGYEKQLPIVEGDVQKNIYLAKYNELNDLSGTSDSINQTFKDYLEYLSTKYDNGSKFKYRDHVLIMEKCERDNLSSNYNLNCKYAFLETAVK